MPRGGARPGAGAPKGNMNALKHGLYSKQFAQIGRDLDQASPKIRETLAAHTNRAGRERQAAEERLALILTRVLQRGTAMAQRETHLCTSCKRRSKAKDPDPAVGLNLHLDAVELDTINDAANRAALREIRAVTRAIKKIEKLTATQSNIDTPPPEQ